MQLRVCALGWVLALTAACAHQETTPTIAATATDEATQESVAAAQQALERDNQERQLAKGVPLQIDNPYGDVRLRFGGYRDTLEWRSVAQNAASPNKIGLTGTEGPVYVLAARLPAGTTLAPTQRVDLTVYVPLGHDIEVITERGLIEARGVKASLKIRSIGGDIALRGVEGKLDVETSGGSIEAQLEPAPAGSQQRIATSTGTILLGLGDDLNAHLNLASSGVFATEFSVQIEQLVGQEPNKHGRVEIGKPDAQIEIYSKRGDIHLRRRTEFRPA
jgi:hypothetical protein